ncbi:peptidase S41 family protein [Colletotrichum sojae]|uniref:Peptidase S41 family protein n=1 Tax=Colletotrichum sojae TaxID=2175907 RepID=A0A8H6MGL0_9PEZI|nr:peptidase S41 family protein [Colletotrichum sojae]
MSTVTFPRGVHDGDGGRELTCMVYADKLAVRPSLAFDCLRSVPVDVDRDVALIKYLRPWLEFQSTIGILPTPPEGYLYPAVDIFGGLDNITQILKAGSYQSQLDFAVDLYRLINVKPRDGHLAFTPIIGTLFGFETPALFVSISEDGVANPKIYLHSDYEQGVEQGYIASEVVRFDSVPILDHIQQRSIDNSRDQDPDAAYNSQLYSTALANVLETTTARQFLYTTLADESVIGFANIGDQLFRHQLRGEATLPSDVLADLLDFSRVSAEFVETSRKQGKSRLIIDLQGNGGGLVWNAMSLYATLFPDNSKAHMKTRVRAHPLLNWVGTMLGKMGVDIKTMPYPVGFYGPEKIGEDEYTNIIQPQEVSYAADGLPGIFAIPEPWFKPEDTIIVTDGHCASACAYIVGLMTRELGVQVIAMGGRPIKAPMQAVGGTKGGPVIALGSYQKLWPALGPVKPPQDIDITPFAEADPPLAGLPTDGWTVNSANVYGDDDLATPAQFRYEAANCNLWSAVAAVKWNRARCVKGSTISNDGTMGTSTPGYSEKVLPGFVWAAGPGDVAGVPRSGGSNNHSAGTRDDDKNAAGSARASWGVMSIAVIITALVSVI